MPDTPEPSSLQVDRKARHGRLTEKVKSVYDFLADAIEGLKDTGLKDAVAKAAPWAGVVGETLAETVAPVRFAVRLLENATRLDDPNEVGYLACSMAYQRSVEQALSELSHVFPPDLREARTWLREETTTTDYDFAGFTFESATEHPFIKDAEGFLDTFARDLGLKDGEVRNLVLDVRSRFGINLQMLLSHRETREKMAPFRDLISLGHGAQDASQALLQHADYQRWLFEEMPVLGVEPFSLAQVYVDSDCGKLSWGELDTGNRRPAHESIDPFAEKHGGRQPLLDTLLDLIGDPGFKEAIIIQGPAGSGKSSITLRLCWELLVRQGLRPIRIALKDLDTRDSVAIEEALPAAVRINDARRNPDEREFFGRDCFRDNQIFNESIQFRRAKICPYVLILDGWDEITVGASGSYQRQVERLLHDVRATFLERRQGPPVRILLTGRPTDAVEKSKFLRKDTVLLTLRPRTQEQLQTYIDRVRQAVEHAPATGEAAQQWKRIAQKREELEALVSQYGGSEPHQNLEVLGSPLLAHLALRLMVKWPEDIGPLLANPTIMYRSMVDMVIDQGGKPPEVDYDPEGRPQLTGSKLRELLHKTAEAMTVLGKESLSYEELAQWLQVEGSEMESRSESLGENVLSRLMVSFFFQGGHRHLGCEFTHKSFREYLFAERLVEGLKRHARSMTGPLPERPAERNWKDFESDDPRRALCHELIHLLGPQWMRSEVRTHVSNLIAWEMARATGKDPYPAHGTPTTPLAITGWTLVRDSLADAWDWWGEGVHLRPQLVEKKGPRREYEMTQALVAEVVESLCIKPLEPKSFQPIRSTTIDAHLGDGLFFLAQSVHAQMLEEQGGKAVSHEAAEPSHFTPRRRYQYRIQIADQERVLFAPSGPTSIYFGWYIARINAAGFRPESVFPTHFSLSHAYLSETNLSGANLSGANLSGANLSGANLSGANLSGANLSDAYLSDANLSYAYLSYAYLGGAYLGGAYLGGAYLIRAYLSGANLSGANLSGADLSCANLNGADLSDANLSDADLSSANLRGANLNGADLSDADLSDADLSDAYLSDANLISADLSGANLSDANLSGAKLSRLMLQKAISIEGVQGLDTIRDN